MSERIFAVFLLLLSVAGIVVGWGLKAPVEYEPVGPRAFPLLVYALLGVCSLALLLSRPLPTKWAPPPVLLRIGGLFAVVLAYAFLFDKIGFIVSTALMTVPLARFFGANWRQAITGSVGLAVALYLLFDRLLDVALPTGLWLQSFLG